MHTTADTHKIIAISYLQKVITEQWLQVFGKDELN
jgi:hypothetical protein